MKILILGGTGFLGKYIVKELSGIASHIYIVTRNSKSNVFSKYSNVELISGDITAPEIFTDLEQKKTILSECSLVIHAAALYDLQASYEDLYQQNVIGTQNVLRVLKQMNKIKLFYYISSIAVASEQEKMISETIIKERSTFPDNYSKTKYFAENLVNDFYLTEKNLPIRIIRPGIIVGDSINGEIDKVNGPYYFLELIQKFSKILKLIPSLPLAYNPKTLLNIIPVDHVAHFIYLLIERDSFNQELKFFHLVSINPPTIQNYIDDISQEYDLKTKFYPVKSNVFIRSVLPLIKIPKELIPFMFSPNSYDIKLTLKELPELKESTYANFKKIFFVKNK